jgi:hypothetical protein
MLEINDEEIEPLKGENLGIGRRVAADPSAEQDVSGG